MSELCTLIIYSLKVVFVIILVWIMVWSGVAGFGWWSRKKNEDGWWDMWKKWLVISLVAMGVVVIVTMLLPGTVCKPPEVIDVPYYGQ